MTAISNHGLGLLISYDSDIEHVLGFLLAITAILNYVLGLIISYYSDIELRFGFAY